MHPRILHLDIDAFLASIEQILEPALVGRPVVVGSGVVASRSYEAKARGVETAMAIHEARRRCQDLVVRDGDARIAERFRQRVAEVLAEFTPVVQVASLDDLYADLTGAPLLTRLGSARILAEQVRERVRAATGLSVAQGIGSNKTVARMATRYAKPGGIVEIAAGEERAFVAPQALRLLPGIGAATATILEDWNLRTVGELAALDQELLVRAFGARGAQLWHKAQGLDDEPVATTPRPASIARETSFPATAESGFVLAMASYLLDRAAAEMRRQQLQARTLAARVRHEDGQAQERQRSLAMATDRTDLLQAVLRGILAGFAARRVRVRHVGVTLAGFERSVARQRELFAHEAERRQALFAAIDRVRARHGFQKVVLGGSAPLLAALAQDRDGFVLRTPSLSR